MNKKTKIKLLGGSLTVIAVLVAVPAARGLAATEAEPEAGPAVCAALAGDLQDTVSNLQSGLGAVPPDLAGVTEPVNELHHTALGLIDLGCLPAPELPVPERAESPESRVAIPVPTLPPVDPGLPTVPVCTDLTADLLDAVTGVLASLLATGLPDLTGALDALTALIDTLTGATAEGCLPAAPVSS